MPAKAKPAAKPRPMRVLWFTWEFPPLIAGGLAMACYGMVKALLKQGVEIDLVLPTREEVYFPLRTPEDADDLPVVWLDDTRRQQAGFDELTTMDDRMDAVGVSDPGDPYDDGQDNTDAMRYYISHITQNFADYTSDFEEVWDDLSVHLMGDEDIFRKVQQFTLRAERFAEKLEYDAIHAHDWLCYAAGMIAKKMSGKPLVAHIHATEFDRAGGAGNERVHKIEFAGMTYADIVCAVSRYTAEMIIARYRVDTGKIRIVHNAFFITDELKDSVRRIFEGTTILFLGRITLQKGPEYFLEVARRVLSKHPEARFIVAGSGDMARKITHQSARMGLRNRFLFAGFLNRREVEYIVKASDIYMLPSISEPFGIAPLEAMAYGVTAVISKQSGVSEVVQNAYKLDFWDIAGMVRTINYLIEHPDKRREMGQAGMKEVHAIQWDGAATKIKEAYEEVIGDATLPNPSL